MSSRSSRPLKMIYCTIGIAILLYSGYVVETLVMHIWHKAPRKELVDAHITQEEKLFKKMIEGVEGDHNIVAYKKINTLNRLYDFHKTKETAVPDSRNLCISCHGDIPHNKKKETRAFLNMHAFFMACETCHIRIDSRMDKKYIWYDKTTGKEIGDIDLNHYLGNTPYKLMPVKKDGARLYGDEKMVKYVTGFKAKVAEMIPSDKRAALDVIHRPMAEIKDTVACEECHKSDRDAAYLPYEQIGYPQRRSNQLVGNEVVGMIGKYKRFYLPNLLMPKEGADSDK